jgi:DNA-binding PadR family transcriptional regulator
MVDTGRGDWPQGSGAGTGFTTGGPPGHPHHGHPPFPPAPPGPPGPPPAPPPGPGYGGMFGPGPASLNTGPRVRKGDVRAAALALLAEGPRNGYQIIQEITERSHGIWRPSPGSVYPALQQLEDERLVTAEEHGGRRTYRLTDEGRAHVAERHEGTEPWAVVAESVSEEMADLRVLFGQVGMAMRQVAEAGTPAQHSAAGRILADTRRALYRLLAEDPADHQYEEDE